MLRVSIEINGIKISSLMNSTNFWLIRINKFLLISIGYGGLLLGFEVIYTEELLSLELWLLLVIFYRPLYNGVILKRYFRVLPLEPCTFLKLVHTCVNGTTQPILSNHIQ